MRQVMLTTIDNPYDPFDEFDRWLEYDMSMNYNSCPLLARICITSTDVGDEQYIYDVEKAIDEIIEYDPFNIYKKVVKDI
jgi:hypothetical protein